MILSTGMHLPQCTCRWDVEGIRSHLGRHVAMRAQQSASTASRENEDGNKVRHRVEYVDRVSVGHPKDMAHLQGHEVAVEVDDVVTWSWQGFKLLQPRCQRVRMPPPRTSHLPRGFLTDEKRGWCISFSRSLGSRDGSVKSWPDSSC